MKKLKFMLEYQSVPIWLFNSKNEMIGPGIPNELSSDKEFVSLINDIQKEYDDLFENNDVYFGYHGFSNEADSKAFFTKVAGAIEILKHHLGNSYEIVVDVSEKDFR